jgi:hypothetical protein
VELLGRLRERAGIHNGDQVLELAQCSHKHILWDR